MKIAYIVILSLFIFSCSQASNTNTNEAENDTNNQPETADDQNKQTFPKELLSLKDAFRKKELPLIIGEGDIEDKIPKGELTLDQLEFLSKNFIKTHPSEDFMVEEAKRLYKLKAKGKYDAYVAQLDLAGLKDATAHPYGLIDLDSALIFLWCIQYNSYEACPYYEGTELFASRFYKDSVTRTFFLGREMVGGDPPASAETYTNIEIKKNLEVMRNMVTKTYEEDELVDTDSKRLQFGLDE